MKTIVIAASKGGTGKTALAAALGAHLDHAAVLDLDPQRSLTRFLAIRVDATGDECRPALLTFTDPELAKREAVKRGWGHLIVDTPPGNIAVTGRAIAIADLILVPVRAAAVDITAINPVVELAKQHKKPFAFVITQTLANTKDAKEMLVGCRAYLASLGRVLEPTIAHRSSWASAPLHGLTAPEIDKTARSDLVAILAAASKCEAAR